MTCMMMGLTGEVTANLANNHYLLILADTD